MGTNRKSCPECGYILNGTEATCPECGYVLSIDKPQGQAMETPQPQTNKNQACHQPDSERKSNDWAHYIYECGVIFWHSLTSKFAIFSGRASRREYWSFFVCTWLFLIPTQIGVFVAIIPFLAVAIRRMHDIGKSGWWSIVPVANIFLSLKRSDEGDNEYGEPCDYSQILS